MTQIPFPLDLNEGGGLTPDVPSTANSTSTSTPEPTPNTKSNPTPTPEPDSTSTSTSSSRKRRYKTVQARGPRKKHGLAIVYDSNKFELAGEYRVVRYDEEFISAGLPPGSLGNENQEGQTEQDKRDEERKRRGGTRQTKNIGLVVGLEFVGKAGKGVIVGTTHL